MWFFNFKHTHLILHWTHAESKSSFTLVYWFIWFIFPQIRLIWQLCILPVLVYPQQGQFTNPETPGYVGFANLPNQVHRKSVKKGFEFTLMVVGECMVASLSDSATLSVCGICVCTRWDQCGKENSCGLTGSANICGMHFLSVAYSRHWQTHILLQNRKLL